MCSVEFESDLKVADLPHEQIKKLLCEMFRDRPGVCSVRLAVFPGGHIGLSGVSVLLAQPYGANGAEQNPMVIRIGLKAVIDDERQRYQKYVEPHTGFGKVQQRLYATIDSHSAIAYDYLDQRPGQPLKTLRDFLWEEEQEQDLEAACAAVTTLFRTTLAQHNRRNNWYNDGRLFADQRPLWFYNMLLPPTLTLQFIEPLEKAVATRPLDELLALADQPESTQIIGESLMLHAGGKYPHLRIVERGWKDAQRHVRLYLYEGPIIDADLYQPLRRIAARIDLLGPAQILDDLPTDLDQMTLAGEIVGTRYLALEAYWQRCATHLPRQDADGRLRVNLSLQLANPIRQLSELLAKPRAMTIAVAHGDMNLGNILMSRSETGQSVAAWLIDFDKTAPGQHAVFDAVKLETEYKVHILPHLARGVDDLIYLEWVLHQALIDPDEVGSLLKGRPHLRDAYQFLATVRRIALQDLMHAIAPEEYYLGLVGYGLAVLKYENLYAEHRQHWLQQDPLIDPPALAAYISASYAATVIEQCRDRGVGIYPELQHLTRRRFKRPFLVGRDELLAKAQVQLRSDPLSSDPLQRNPPIVRLYGSSGSGRGAVADLLCADLERRGYLIWPLPGLHNDGFEDIETLLKALVLELRDAGVRRLRAPARPIAESKVSKRTREEEQWRWYNQFRTIIDCLEQHQQHVVLRLWLPHANPELRAIIAQIAPLVRHTVLLIVAEHPFNDMNAGIPLLVNPLAVSDIAAYVRHKQLPLDAEAVQKLHTESLGRPFVLERIIWDAQVRAHQHGLSLNDVIRQIVTTRDYLKDAAKDLLQQQGPLIRRMLVLDALIDAQTSAGLSDARLADSERMTIIAATGGPGSDRADTLLARYQEQGFAAQDQFVKLLRDDALREFKTQPAYQELCRLLAHTYRNRSPLNFYLIAHFFVLAAEQGEAAATLAQLINDTGQVFTARCPAIYALLTHLLQLPRATILQYERPLIELAGMCAMYLGKYAEAITHYTSLLGFVRRDDPAYSQMLVRLLQISAAYGDHAGARDTCRRLARQPRTPLSACGLTYAGQQLLLPAPDRPAAIDQAIVRFEEALTILGEDAAQWGSEADFCNEERARLYDLLGRAAMLRGDIALAIDQLQQAREIVLKLENMPLLAAIENNLGYIYYYKRGDYGDPQAAAGCFERALKTRNDIGDVVGQLRTAQNLANLRVNLAADRAGWDAANDLFQTYEATAHTIQAANRYLIIANFMDTLIDQGRCDKARTLFDSLILADIQDSDTLLILLLNRAKLAVWQAAKAGQGAECEQYLLQAHPLVKNSEDDADTLEWAHIALASHLLLKAPLHKDVSSWIEQLDISDDSRCPERALWRLCQGLLALAGKHYALAHDHLAESRALWQGLKFPFRTAVVAYWQTYCYKAAGDDTGAQLSKYQAESLLTPFEDTPVRRHLAHL